MYDNLDIPMELKVRRDAMMFHVQYLIQAVKSAPERQPELDAATRVLNDINDSVDRVRRQRA